MRIFLNIFLPLIAPLVLYIIWINIDARRKGKGMPDWKQGRWFAALITGCMLALCSLIYLTTLGEDIGGVYQSPTLNNGQVIPGHFK
jgi:hypothetical protein